MAEYAEQHIEDEDAPLFLRFVNLLINDAIFLLDEALGYMKQIQEQQVERETNWQNLPNEERQQNEAQLMHIGRLARYHNIMGTETIQILDRLSGAINSVFTHPAMVDRIAAMLNYFLKNLVGPNRKSFKVCCLCSPPAAEYAQCLFHFDSLLSRAGLGHLGKGWNVRGTTIIIGFLYYEHDFGAYW